MLTGALLGVVTGLLCGLVVIASVVLIIYCMMRKKVPPSPDYKAVGDFQPATVFTWDSTASISKSWQEVSMVRQCLIREATTAAACVTCKGVTSLNFLKG